MSWHGHSRMRPAEMKGCRARRTKGAPAECMPITATARSKANAASTAASPPPLPVTQQARVIPLGSARTSYVPHSIFIARSSGVQRYLGGAPRRAVEWISATET